MTTGGTTGAARVGRWARLRTAVDRTSVRSASIAPDGFSEASVLVEKEAQ